MASAVLPEFRPTAKEMNETVREFSAVWGQAQAENHFHRFSHALSLLVMGGLTILAWAGWHRPVERIYVRQDASGRAQTVPGSAFSYQRDEASLKYFLTQFVHLYYARRKATMASELPRSLYYLDAPLATKARQEWESTDLIKKVAQSSSDFEVRVSQVVLRETQVKPYSAEVDYTIDTVDAGSRQAMESKTYTATIQYAIVDEIPADVVQHNPIGLTITYFRSDESFRKER
jgi:type IV secretory pathway TrbF-like protein